MIRKIIRDRLKKVNVWDDCGAGKKRKERIEASRKPEIDIKALIKNRIAYQPPAPPETLCRVCREPVYFYENADICLWCEKTS